MARKRKKQRLPDEQILGAVDLGSNSFHMVIARLSHGQLVVMDRLRESVRLAAGLDDRNRLDAASQARAMACLARFGERLRNLQAGRVRVVGTNTLRKAKARSTERFRQLARSALGYPVQVISGIEEARLVYLGAYHSLPRIPGPQMVVDIGGGSTELVMGRGAKPLTMESLYMGCVSLSASAFREGRISARAFRKARQTARLELEPVRARFRKQRPVRVAGTSGTIRATYDALRFLGRARHGITVEDLEFLIEFLISAGHVSRLRLPGLSADRAEVLPGGIAILVEVMSSLKLRRMIVAEGALREGILYDMLGRITDEDARERTVRAMMERFRVDARQCRRVSATALMLWEQVCGPWKLARDPDSLILAWAARLHELGLDIAHARYHRHGAYLLENADMPGFSRDEQQVLAAVVRYHRRKFDPQPFLSLPQEWRQRVLRLTVILRLAVLMNRGRSSAVAPPLRLAVSGQRMTVSLPARWLRENPLTEADLARETRYLKTAGLNMRVTTRRR